MIVDKVPMVTPRYSDLHDNGIARNFALVWYSWDGMLIDFCSFEVTSMGIYVSIRFTNLLCAGMQVLLLQCSP